MRGFLTYLFVSLMLCRLQGQDVHFSQFNLSPLTLNPANTGRYKGDYRFFGNYRSQWKELNNAYNTFSAGGDMSFYPGNVHMAGGLVFVNDQSSRDLQVNKILPSFAVQHRVAGFLLGAGLQPGVTIKSVNFYNNSLPEQMNWETGVFDHNLPNTEKLMGQRFTYFDLNAGLAVSRRFGKLEAELGFAAFHLNKPKESFLGGDNKLPIRQAYNFSVSYLTGPLIIKFHGLYGYTDKVNDWLGGLQVDYVLSRDAYFTNTVYAGFMHRKGINRNSDAHIATVGLNYSHYTLGFSYDITISKLKTAVNSKGAFEIALIYKAKSSRLNKKVLPCERY